MPNLLIQPAPVPSWGLAQQRAAQTRGMQNRNLLAERQLQSFPEEQAWKREERQFTREGYEETKRLGHFKTEAAAITAALKGKDTEQANMIYRASGGTSDVNIGIDLKKSTLDYGTHTFTGPPRILEEVFGKISEDPKWATNPETWKWFARQPGVTISEKKPSPYGPDALAFEETKAEIKERTGGYKPKDEAAAIRLKEAGRPQTTINVGEEKFGLQKEISMAERRKNILTAKDDKDAFDADAPIFNKNNKNNEVAYWDAEPGRFHDDKAVILRLPAPAIKAGWTPDKLQEAANAKGITIKQVLKDIGVIK